MSEADNIPFGGKSPPKQVSEPVSPPRGKPRESRKGPEAERATEYSPGTPPRPLSSTPHGSQEKPAPVGGIHAATHKVIVLTVLESDKINSIITDTTTGKVAMMQLYTRKHTSELTCVRPDGLMRAGPEKSHTAPHTSPC